MRTSEARGSRALINKATATEDALAIRSKKGILHNSEDWVAAAATRSAFASRY